MKINLGSEIISRPHYSFTTVESCEWVAEVKECPNVKWSREIIMRLQRNQSSQSQQTKNQKLMIVFRNNNKSIKRNFPSHSCIRASSELCRKFFLLRCRNFHSLAVPFEMKWNLRLSPANFPLEHTAVLYNVNDEISEKSASFVVYLPSAA